MHKRLFSLRMTFLILLTTPLIHAQVSQEWVQRYRGPGGSHSYSRKVVTDLQGNVYITGDSWGDSTGSDYTTIKYNSSGAMKWVQRYNSSTTPGDYARAIVVDNFQNVYVTGYSDENYATIKYDSSGTQQWVRIYNGPTNGSDRANSIALDNFNNVYVTGYSQNAGVKEDIATIKYNSDGILQWIKFYNGTDNSVDEATGVLTDSFNNVIVTGSSVGNASLYDFVTIKYNSEGDQQWVQRYNGLNTPDYISSFTIDYLGNIIVCGSSLGSATLFDGVTIKYNPDGVQQWLRIYSGPDNHNDIFRSVKADSSGNIYETGFTTDNDTGDDIITLKNNSDGDRQWVQTYHAVGMDGAYSLALGNSNSIYITGYSEATNGLKDYEYITMKYNSSGIVQWIERYAGPGDGADIARSIAVDNMGNVIVSGNSMDVNAQLFEFATVKYSQTTNIVNQTSNVDGFALYQNYPNPFNPVTNLEFGISNFGFVSLKVYDVLGNEVITLLNEKKTAGRFAVKFDGNNYASGIYFYSLFVEGERINTKRMILLK